MAKTREAMKIIDKMIGDNPERRERIAEARTNAEIAQMVYDARTSAGLTQKELADMIGTGQSTIARLEDSDYEGHSLSMLQRVAEAVNCHVQLSIVPNEETERMAS